MESEAFKRTDCTGYVNINAREMEIRRTFEGYTARVLGVWPDPYHANPMKRASWLKGYRMAQEDQSLRGPVEDVVGTHRSGCCCLTGASGEHECHCHCVLPPPSYAVPHRSTVRHCHECRFSKRFSIELGSPHDVLSVECSLAGKLPLLRSADPVLPTECPIRTKGVLLVPAKESEDVGS